MDAEKVILMHFFAGSLVRTDRASGTGAKVRRRLRVAEPVAKWDAEICTADTKCYFFFSPSVLFLTVDSRLRNRRESYETRRAYCFCRWEFRFRCLVGALFFVGHCPMELDINTVYSQIVLREGLFQQYACTVVVREIAQNFAKIL